MAFAIEQVCSQLPALATQVFSAKKRLTAACPVFPQSVDFLATRVESLLDSNTVGE
jgi:hypothetical protein